MVTIILLNMLIAKMGDTYKKVTENAELMQFMEWTRIVVRCSPSQVFCDYLIFQSQCNIVELMITGIDRARNDPQRSRQSAILGYNKKM